MKDVKNVKKEKENVKVNAKAKDASNLERASGHEVRETVGGVRADGIGVGAGDQVQHELVEYVFGVAESLLDGVPVFF